MPRPDPSLSRAKDGFFRPEVAMSWEDQLIAIANSAISDNAFGEPMTLPNGITIACIFEPQGVAVNPLHSNVGQGWQIQAEVNPSADIRTGDAAVLTIGQTVRVRGHPYRLVALVPDGTGITTATLMSAPVPARLAPWQ
jgi:hypothetical protein